VAAILGEQAVNASVFEATPTVLLAALRAMAHNDPVSYADLHSFINANDGVGQA